ncbi:hypothetical protein HK097_003719 [Rhizophlyctis rosea]|uniref:SURF4-domain-containing protein n=1 Tax=Rhizophlyctis rosea TaxID=64517 RepID=A0AAD5X923_9FUNG|nr:hypothetical protein HK097_003719 [Rhizophlyctis rosea]
MIIYEKITLSRNFPIFRSQWNDQLYYIQKHRRFPWITGQLFLSMNVIVMTVCSFLAIAKRYTEYAVGGLFLVVISQSLGYGLIFDSSFFFRNLSVIGALLMLLAEAWTTKKKNNFAGLININETDKATYLQLAGRILLVFLFLGFILAGEWSFLRVLVSIVALIGCAMVVVGFKAKWSAWMLVTILSIANVTLNNWWNLHHTHPQKDFLKYDFFQTLSIVGGFLLLTNMGPGGLSMDEKKKSF